MTDEPGIYFIPAYIAKWKAEGTNKEFVNFDKLEPYMNFGGIRIEDDLLITKTGNRILGKRRIPVTVQEIEEFMAATDRRPSVENAQTGERIAVPLLSYASVLSCCPHCETSRIRRLQNP